MFDDRAHAAAALADRLAAWRGRHPLVLAIPRGGVPLGHVIAQRLGGELDVVLVRKLGAPGNPELAVGAVDEAGGVTVAPFAHTLGADAAYLEAETQRQLAAIRARRAQLGTNRPAVDPAGRVVIVVDDGLATGATMKAALRTVRARQPQTLVCAVPVAPQDTLDAVAALADAVVCVEVPRDFHAVGQFYRDFPQVDDAEVAALLGGA
ncbi:phosphoribosyltransferase family protein [Comamonadaceae bacterium G21597-S1]|nr:phosphoribosyltransferase family protein [Comamonadaceae bacterium G21597-S1]